MENNALEKLAKDALSAESYSITFDDENYLIIKESDYKQMLESYRKIENELTQNIIEKEIAKEMPKDFDDVFVVAKSMLKDKPNISEIRKTVREIKARYPNLFIDIDEYFKGVMEFE